MHFLSKENIKYLVIPAAGYGTRMRSITQGGPKESLDIHGKPAIHHSLYAALQSGIKNAVIILRQGKEILEKYLCDLDYARKIFPDAVQELKEIKQSMTVEFAYQKQPLGECEAILYAQPIVENNPFLVIYPDNIVMPYTYALKRVIDQFLRSGLDTVGLKKSQAGPNEKNGGGYVEAIPLEEGLWKITTFFPKGYAPPKGFAYEHLRVSGIYVAKPHYFEFIQAAKKKAEGEINDGLVRNLMRQNGVEFTGINLPGKIFDIGTPEGYRSCVSHFRSP